MLLLNCHCNSLLILYIPTDCEPSTFRCPQPFQPPGFAPCFPFFLLCDGFPQCFGNVDENNILCTGTCHGMIDVPHCRAFLLHVCQIYSAPPAHGVTSEYYSTACLSCYRPLWYHAPHVHYYPQTNGDAHYAR